jgi:hypothetical protein
VRRLGESVRTSLRQLGTIFIGVTVSKIVIGLMDVHNQPLVEVAMETISHLLAHSILHAAITPLSVASLCVAAEALLLVERAIRRN